MNTIKKLIFAIAMLILPLAANADGHGTKKDIVDTAIANGSFTTLVTAVKAAGLVDTLKGKGPFTVFAPTDDAFSKLPKGTIDSLLTVSVAYIATWFCSINLRSVAILSTCLLYTSPSPRDATLSRMPSSA